MKIDFENEDDRKFIMDRVNGFSRLSDEISEQKELIKELVEFVIDLHAQTMCKNTSCSVHGILFKAKKHLEERGTSEIPGD